MKLIYVLVLLARGKTSSAPRASARRPRAITVPAPRQAVAAKRLVDFQCRVPLHVSSAEPPTSPN